MDEENIVVPIDEVKIENEITSIENNNQSVTNKTSNEEPKNSKFSTVMLILLFTFLFTYVMGMPYINEFISKLQEDKGISKIEQEAIDEEKRQEAENQKPTSTPNVTETKELTCTLVNSLNSNYTLVEIQKLYYDNNNQVLSSSYSYQYTFVAIDDYYNSLKNKCDQDSLKYVTHEGYTMGCSYDDVNISISHEFDLETFKPIVDGDTNIVANATYKENIETVKNELINSGYSCQ